MKRINNWINGTEQLTDNAKYLKKYNPHNREVISEFIDSNSEDVEFAIKIANETFDLWKSFNPIKRGDILSNVVNALKEKRSELAKCIALETGKSLKDAIGEVNAAIQCANFYAGEGMRLYSNTLTSGVDYKYCHTVRQPIGVAGLIVPANTPIANIVWKTFPALICGNSVVLKASEDAPETAQLFASITKLGGLPDGIFNVIYGRGEVSGNILVSNTKVDIVSFTGSTSVGKIIGEICGKRLAKVSLELGGKNPFVVWEDANLNLAVKWAVLSAFSNAGQRCAAGSRILIHSNIYEKFKNLFVDATKKLKIGNDDNSDLGPVINQRQYDNINKHITEAINEGGKIISGGNIPDSKIYKGYYIEPTIIEGLSRDSKIVNTEMFGPLVTLHKVDNLEEALDFANSTEFGLTAAIHTKNINHAMWFVQNVKAGVANVNMGTYGSEPHMPFGGVGASGNGTREPGVEAINIYSELKNISIQIDL